MASFAGFHASWSRPPHTSRRLRNASRSPLGDTRHLLRFSHGSRPGKILIDLLVQVYAIGNLSLVIIMTSGAAVGGVSGDNTHPDNIIFDFKPTANGGVLNPNGPTADDSANGMTVSSPSGFGHPTCLNPPTLSTLPAVRNP